MAVTNISVRMDEDLKKQTEALLNKMGLNMSTAINMFAKAIVLQQKIPFEITAVPQDTDPYYERNRDSILRGIAALNAGKGVEHELITD